MMIFANEDDIELVIRKTFTILFFVFSTFVIYIYTGLPTKKDSLETTDRNLYRLHVCLYSCNSLKL